MIKIIIRLSAHNRIGLGHAVRMGALVAGLRQMPDLPETEWVMVGEGDLWRPFFPFSMKHIFWPDEQAINDQDWPCHLWLHDHPLRPLHRLQGPKQMVVIDDYGGSVGGDLIINGSVLAAQTHYEPSPARLLLGANFALMRPQWAKATWCGHKGTNLVIILGSGPEASQFGCEWAERLSELSIDWQLHFIIGAGFHNQDALKRALPLKAHLHQALSPDEMIALLSQSRLCITTGGMIAYEVITMGVPALIMPQLDDLKAEIDYFADKGGCVDLSQTPKGQWMSLLLSRLSDEGWLNHMSKCQKSLMDGRGIGRICAEIGSLIKG